MGNAYGFGFNSFGTSVTNTITYNSDGFVSSDQSITTTVGFQTRDEAKEKFDKDFAANLKKITDDPKLSEAEKSYMINELAAQAANLDPAATQKAWAANRIANNSSLSPRQKEELLKRLDEGKMTQADMKAIGIISADSNTAESRNGFWENLGGSILDGVKYLAGQSSSADGYVDENGNWVQATCFTKGTKVKTPTGYRNIEDIRAGDRILSYNEATKLLAVQTVAQTFIRKADRIYTLLYDNGSRLQTTATHPFYIEGKGWVKAADLHVGDDSLLSREVSQLDVYGGARLQNVSYRQSKQGVIVGIMVEERSETVYNFEVNETHTYLVGESDVVVHNAGEEYSPLGFGGDASLLLAKVFYMTPMGMKLKTLLQKDIPRKLDELMFPGGHGLTDKEYQEYRASREQYRKQWAEDGAAASIMAAGALCAATMVSCNVTNIEKQRDEPYMSAEVVASVNIDFNFRRHPVQSFVYPEDSKQLSLVASMAEYVGSIAPGAWREQPHTLTCASQGWPPIPLSASALE